jgi:FlaG/FlaF family flagellin (archaellin)
MKRTNKAVSEIVGTLLLIGISITLFSVIFIFVSTIYPSSSRPSVNLICSAEKNNIIIEHRGGKTLDLDTKLTVAINGTNNKFIVGDYLNNKSRDNGVWNIGEQVVLPVGDITDKNISISVVDVHSNSLIMMVILLGDEL